ncbi:MAG: HK97 family phage prohead protease [Alphaproteobacteria bacterium]
MSTNNLRLSPALSLKRATVEKTGEFSGYGSVFDVVDSYGEKVAPGAFSETLRERGSKGIKMLWQHSAAEPIGTWTELREDEYGLFVKGQIELETRRGRDAHALLKSGALDGLSIGFVPKKSLVDEESGLVTLSEIDLWEISLVTFAANSAAMVQAVKSIETKTDLEKLLRGSGLSRSAAKAVCHGGYPALRNADGADPEKTDQLVAEIRRRQDELKSIIRKSN